MIQPLKITFQTIKGENQYEIKCPNVGQFYDIEVTKQVLGKGFYSSIVSTTTAGAQNAADMIDIESHLKVLMPESFFKDDLKCESFKDLGLQDYNEIKKTYIKHFLPWWREIHDILKMDKIDEE